MLDEPERDQEVWAMRKRDLEALVAAQQRTIDELRSKLCHDGHDWVLVNARKVYDEVGGLVFFNTSVCARCGKRKTDER